MVLAPKLEFREIEPLQDYYYDGQGGYYSIAKLHDDTKELPIFDCPVAALDLSAEAWEGCDMFDLAFHVKRVNEADLSMPILLDWQGSIADGRHRVIKAIVEGKRTIKARRMTWKPVPCKIEEC